MRPTNVACGIGMGQKKGFKKVISTLRVFHPNFEKV